MSDDRTTAREAVYTYLNALNIPFDRFTHAPAYSMEDYIELCGSGDYVNVKNYFLTTKSKKVYCVLITRPAARFRTADVSKQAGTPRLTFADESDMLRLLNTRPGMVSPLGLIFDETHQVRLLCDRELMQAEHLAFHPCDNTATVIFSAEDFFQRFVPSTGREAFPVDIRDFDEGFPK